MNNTLPSEDAINEKVKRMDISVIRRNKVELYYEIETPKQRQEETYK